MKTNVEIIASNLSYVTRVLSPLYSDRYDIVDIHVTRLSRWSVCPRQSNDAQLRPMKPPARWRLEYINAEPICHCNECHTAFSPASGHLFLLLVDITRC